MKLLSYFPRRRHLNRGKDGWVCVGCMKIFRRFVPLWAHKVVRRHPWNGYGVAADYVVVDGYATSLDPTFRWTHISRGR